MGSDKLSNAISVLQVSPVCTYARKVVHTCVETKLFFPLFDEVMGYAGDILCILVLTIGLL